MQLYDTFYFEILKTTALQLRTSVSQSTENSRQMTLYAIKLLG